MIRDEIEKLNPIIGNFKRKINSNQKNEDKI